MLALHEGAKGISRLLGIGPAGCWRYMKARKGFRGYKEGEQ
jgi:hypothetical protein